MHWRSSIAALTVALAATVALAGPASAKVTTPQCPAVSWGSQPREVATMNPSPLVAVRTGQHPCFDRVVFTIAGSVGVGWSAGYVGSVEEEGSGSRVPVPGGALLGIVLHHPAYDVATGTSTFPHPIGPVADVTEYRTLRSAVYAGSFEGRSAFGVGVRARLPYRLFAVPGPGGDTRIVLDVAHRWTSF